MKKDIVLALDLEYTLISSATLCFSRPGLHEFLLFCQNTFERLVIFTTVSEATFQRVAQQLMALNEVPPWFGDLEYITWDRRGKKDLRLIPDANVKRCYLLDDRREYVCDSQINNWITIEPYEFVGEGVDNDRELQKVIHQLNALQ
ncbi:HAD family hydrolase [Aliiglaciecola sp.]|nr:HAD family hydrolase [Aliiglaciecola sp.]